jgi:hypothetical protein
VRRWFRALRSADADSACLRADGSSSGKHFGARALVEEGNRTPATVVAVRFQGQIGRVQPADRGRAETFCEPAGDAGIPVL